ncbi:MAG: hypothetical protein NT069_30900 [Planctomycetota bacterium]|nr:hypothetical protein [Planctomycetota bacterium]
MKRQITSGICVATLVIGQLVGCQVPAGPQGVTPRPMRDWLPQDAKKNADGTRPWKERKPPLRRIADPANMESNNAAIKQAAKIKAEEDKKEQKLKAIRYLCTIGCGCYDKDGQVTAALKESLMEECTEEVRYATIETIISTASAGRCQTCNQCSCCKKELVDALAELAYGTDEQGCPKEPSARVRELAVQALQICCPYTGLSYVPEAPPEIPRGVVEPGTLPGADSAEGQSEGTEAEGTEASPPSPGAAGRAKIGRGAVRPVGADSGDSGVTTSADRSLPSQERPARVIGIVASVDANDGIVQVRLPDDVQLVTGSRMMVYHRHSSRRVGTTGEIEVVQSSAGMATARVTEQLAVADVARGDRVVLLGEGN